MVKYSKIKIILAPNSQLCTTPPGRSSLTPPHAARARHAYSSTIRFTSSINETRETESTFTTFTSIIIKMRERDTSIPRLFSPSPHRTTAYHTRPYLTHLRPSQSCTIHLTSDLPPPSKPPHLHHTVPYHNGRPNGVPSRRHAHTHSTPRGGVGPSRARPSRAVRALEAGAWRHVPRPWLVIVRGRQPSAGRRAGRLSPAARAPRRGCSAPCAS